MIYCILTKLRATFSVYFYCMNLFLIILSSLLLCFTGLSLIRHDYWTFRVFDYPRLQKFVLSIVCVILLVFFLERDKILYPILIAAMSLNVIYLFVLIVRFTPIGKKHVLRVTSDLPDQSLNIMVANVYQYNTNFKGCLQEIKKADPDIVLLLETDQRWDDETRELGEIYPFELKVPLENTYGMLFYSRLKVLSAEVKHLVEVEVPSIHAQLELKNGTKIQLYALHPSPPVPNENPRSTERDKELLIVADLAKASKLPVIVMGDLNDVAWSYTTELFLKMSGLLDPRRGRGFYNSFHARYPFLRFPLDHVFISTDFKLRKMCRLSNFDSDHFPIFTSLQYEAKASDQQSSMKPDRGDIETAEEKKAK